MSEIRVWVNGRRVDAHLASIAAVDHGVTVGDGVFETCKVIEGKPFAVSRHLRRMDQSLAGLGLPRADHEVVGRGISEVLAGDPLPLGRLRWTVTGGLGPLGSDRHSSDLTYIVTAASIAPQPTTASVVTVPWARNERAATVGLKTTSYADNVVALAFAQRAGATEAIFANTRGELCEGTGSNIFVVVDGRVLTPPVDSGCLAGITRGLVLEWASAEGIDIREESMPLGILATCDEVFLTSSLKDVRPVDRVDDRALAPGPLTARLADLWQRAAALGLDP